jgi:hypothetical protein
MTAIKRKRNSEKMLRDLVKRIFEEETAMDCNFLVRSKFWIRHRIIGGCNHGDEYSEPNIDNIVQAIEEEMKAK